MLAHPTGRLLLSREPYRIDIKRIIDAASELGTVIELNAHPQRLDLDWRWLKYAKEQGIKISINPDAHQVDGFDVVRFGVGIARKGWLEAGDVVNTMGFDKITKFLAALCS